MTVNIEATGPVRPRQFYEQTKGTYEIEPPHADPAFSPRLIGCHLRGLGNVIFSIQAGDTVLYGPTILTDAAPVLFLPEAAFGWGDGEPGQTISIVLETDTPLSGVLLLQSLLA